MKEERSQNVTMQNEVKGRGLFYGVIAVATFIIMAVGTTFAYFTATTSSADTAVKTGSTTLRLKYISYEGAWMNQDLIPANTDIVEYSFEYQNDTTINTDENHEDWETMRYNALCKDDYGNSICSVYVFQVENSANSPQDVALDVLTQTNEFSSLNAMAYELTEPTDTESDDYKNYFPTVGEDGSETTFSNPLNGLGDPIFNDVGGAEGQEPDAIIVQDGDGNQLGAGSYSPVYVNRLGITKTLLKYNDEGDMVPAIDRAIKVIDPMDPENRTVRIADAIRIDGNSMKTFALVLYIKNDKNRDQTETDAAKSFYGQVIVGSGDGSGGGVSGQIGVASKDKLQSATGGTEEDPDAGDDEVTP